MKKIIYIFMVATLVWGATGFINHVQAVSGGDVVVASNPLFSFLRTTFNVGKSIGTTVREAGPQVEGCVPGSSFNITGCVAVIFNQVVLRLASIFLWIAGWFFNATLAYSLNMGGFLETVPIVSIGWKVCRDLANLCFIFILLYIAITTIVQANVSNSKKMLVNVVVIAVLLNFSLFLTKVVVDASNILALQFYAKMQTQSGDFGAKISAQTDKGVSQTFIKGLGLSGIYTAGEEASKSNTAKPNYATTVGNVFAISVGGSILIMVAAFVFFAAAIMFIIRTIVLIFLMILAPLALASLILPKTQQYFQMWFKNLINQSFFAPFYMLFLYLIIGIVGGTFGPGVNLGTFLTGDPSAVASLYVFVVLIGLMLGSLIIAKSMGAYGGAIARKWAGNATFGLAGWMGRQSAGRFGKYLGGNDRINQLANNQETGIIAGAGRIFGKSIQKTGKFASKQSYDMRGFPGAEASLDFIGGAGKVQGDGGFAKMKEEEAKKKAEKQKSAVLDSKKAVLTEALDYKKKNPNSPDADNKIQSALYSLSESEFSELGSEKLTNADIIRFAKPAQIAAVTDDKFDKLSADKKKEIGEKRLAPLKAAGGKIETDSSGAANITAKSAENILSRFKAISSDAQDKIKGHKAYGAAGTTPDAGWDDAVNALNGNDAGEALRKVNALGVNARSALLSSLKGAHIKSEMGKLGAKEKANSLDDLLKQPITDENKDVLSYVDGDTIKAYENRDLPPAEKDKLKQARHEVLVKDLDPATLNKDRAQELLKGAKAGDLVKLIKAVGTTNPSLAELLTQSHLRELENDASLTKTQKQEIGDTIRATTGANAEHYVKIGGKGEAAWS